MAKAAGLYREEPKDSEPRQVTQVTVVLNHVAGRTTSET